jgi:hypothetical protein
MNANFERGKCYFLIRYYDRSLKVPEIDTYIFIGQHKVGKDNNYWMFQEPRSYLSVGQMDRDSKEVICLSEEEVLNFLSWEDMLEELRQNKVMQDAGRSFSERE